MEEDKDLLVPSGSKISVADNGIFIKCDNLHQFEKKSFVLAELMNIVFLSNENVNHEHNWSNYHFKSPAGDNMILTLIPNANNKFEVKLLKEDEDFQIPVNIPDNLQILTEKEAKDKLISGELVYNSRMDTYQSDNTILNVTTSDENIVDLKISTKDNINLRCEMDENTRLLVCSCVEM